MQHLNSRISTRIMVAALGLTLVATSCATETIDTAALPIEPAPATTDATADTVPSSAPATTLPAPVTEPVAVTAPATEPPTPEPEVVETPPTTEPPAPATDDLAVEPVEPPEPTDVDDSPDDDLACALPAMSDDAIVGNEIWVDLDGEGGDNDRIVAYFDGAWKLRAEFSVGVQSEIEIPGAGVHGVRVLGFADVDLTYGGEEILAVVGGGASSVEIGVFSFYEGGCIFRYQAEGGGDFGVYSGASVMNGAGVVCGEGYITSWGFERDDDDTYAMWDASFEPVSLGVFGYMPASDGYAEGLSFDDLNSSLFDCNGLSL